MNPPDFASHCANAKAGSLILDPGPRAVIQLRGADRERFLNGQVTAKVTGLPPGTARHTGITDAKGRLQGEGWIHHDGESFLLDVPWSIGTAMLERIDRYLIADDVELSDASTSWRILHRIGGAIDGVTTPQVASRRYGLPGIDLWLRPGEAPPLPLAPPEVTEAFRIAAGFPAWDIDMNPTHLAPEALPAVSISADKGCYIGQEVISRIRTIGRVNKKLTRLVCLDESWIPPALPFVLEHEGNKLATLTSVARNPTGGWQALAWVSRGVAEPGQSLPNPYASWTLSEL